MRHILNQILNKILRPHAKLELQPVLVADMDANEFADFSMETDADWLDWLTMSTGLRDNKGILAGKACRQISAWPRLIAVLNQ